MALLNSIWVTYLDIAPYLFIGLFFAGLLHIFFRKDMIVRHLGKNNFWSALKAALLGVPMPLCSCGVIPTALHLRKSGTSRGATMSFLISTPQTGIDSIIPTFAMMGPVFAIFRPLAALVMGIAGGIAINLSGRDSAGGIADHPEDCPGCEVCKPARDSAWAKLKNGTRYAFVTFLDDIALQLIVGVILAGVIGWAVPDDFFLEYGGRGFLGMLMMIAVGVPLYVCATASIPIAVTLILKGISPGAAFVFLVVGPATNAATISVIGRAMGRKVITVYLAVIVVGALAGGFLLNYIFSLVGAPQLMNMMHEHGQRPWYEWALMALFSLLLAASLWRRVRHGHSHDHDHEHTEDAMHKTFRIAGMTCNHCAAHVTSSLQAVQGVVRVEVDLAGKSADISGDFDAAAIRKAVHDAGYKVEG
ncbi:MAG: permease [Candidatus Cloacimonetes bacterium]|nr:permease [Candidatus Cloacimonadota bacterium]